MVLLLLVCTAASVTLGGGPGLPAAAVAAAGSHFLRGVQALLTALSLLTTAAGFAAHSAFSLLAALGPPAAAGGHLHRSAWDLQTALDLAAAAPRNLLRGALALLAVLWLLAAAAGQALRGAWVLLVALSVFASACRDLATLVQSLSVAL